MRRNISGILAIAMSLIMTLAPVSDVWAVTACGEQYTLDENVQTEDLTDVDTEWTVETMELQEDEYTQKITEVSEMPEAAGTSYKNPVKNANSTVSYDCVWFGNYWQEDTDGNETADTSDQKTPIKWRVLAASDSDLFLLADKILDCVAYNTSDESITWENSTIRSWLNGYSAASNTCGTDYMTDNFIDKAFSGSEKDAIKISVVDNSVGQGQYTTESGNDTNDKLFFLSYKDTVDLIYGFSESDNVYDKARWAKVTKFAKARGAYANSSVEYAGNGGWWLRSPGNYSNHAARADSNGGTYSDKVVNHPDTGVRPALHISPSSSFIYPAGTVCSDGTVNEIPREEPGEEPGEDPGEDPGEEPRETVKDKRIVAGQKINLKEMCFPDITADIARYTVDDKKAASVSKGMLKGKKAGTVKVTAQKKISKNKYEDIASCTVKVLNKPKLKFANHLTYTGQTLSANEMFTTEDTKTIGATLWESSKPGVVEVTDSAKGILTARQSGSAKITAYFGEKGKKGTLKVSAKISVKIPAFKKTSYTVKNGGKLTISMKNVKGTTNVEWTAVDTNRISVAKQLNSKGNPTGKVIVTGLSVGDTKLKATIDGQEYYCDIHVVDTK